MLSRRARGARRRRALARAHLEDFHHHLLVVGDVDGFEDLAVLAAAELPHELVVILVAAGEAEQEAVRRRQPGRGGARRRQRLGETAESSGAGGSSASSTESGTGARVAPPQGQARSALVPRGPAASSPPAPEPTGALVTAQSHKAPDGNASSPGTPDLHRVGRVSATRGGAGINAPRREPGENRADGHGSAARRGHPRGLQEASVPPLHDVRLVVPVLAGSLRVDVRVDPGPAGHRPRHASRARGAAPRSP